jgi:hypothetical protein
MPANLIEALRVVIAAIETDDEATFDAAADNFLVLLRSEFGRRIVRAD